MDINARRNKMITSLPLEDFTPDQIETVKAFALAVKSKSKKNIECRHIDGNWGGIVISDEMNILYNYRIKPQPKLIPFDYSDAERLMERIVKSKNIKTTKMIIALSDADVSVSGQWISYRTLLNEFLFLDGSPCGKKEL